MAAQLLEEPARLVCWFTRGTTATIELPERENPQLVRDMANGLIGLIHPHGRVDAETTVEEFVRAMRLFAAAMAKRGHVGGAAELTRPALVEQLWATGHRHESMIRRMLAAFDQDTQALRPEVRELVGGRAYNPQRRRDKKPLLPYDETVWSRLQEVCRAEIQEAWSQFRRPRRGRGGKRPLSARLVVRESVLVDGPPWPGKRGQSGEAGRVDADDGLLPYGPRR